MAEIDQKLKKANIKPYNIYNTLFNNEHDEFELVKKIIDKPH
jgi:hypothetical protein